MTKVCNYTTIETIQVLIARCWSLSRALSVAERNSAGDSKKKTDADRKTQRNVSAATTTR